MSKIPPLLIALLASCGVAHAQDSRPTVWDTSFVPGVVDGNGNFLGGTEIRALVAFKGKLYAANGYWMDQWGSEGKQTAQVLVLNSSHAFWQQDVNFGSFCPTNRKKCALATSALDNLVFVSDKNGTPVNNVNVLTASTWDTRDVAVAPVYSKNNTDDQWYETILSSDDPGGQVRSFATHVDTITGQDFAFAGEKPNGIFHGLLSDKRGAGKQMIEWTTGAANVEFKTSSYTGPKCGKEIERIAAFAEANGKLFNTICFQILKRVDGPQGSCKPDEVSVNKVCQQRWQVLWTDEQAATSQTGLRGLTTVKVGDKEELLVAEEGSVMRVIRIDPDTGFAHTELDTRNFLSNLFNARVTYGISAYNDFDKWVDPNGVRKQIIGLEAYITPQVTVPRPNLPFDILDGGGKLTNDAYYLVRNASESYQLIRIPSQRTLGMVAVRTAIQSPFKDECPDAGGKGCPIYFGGFDANKSTSQTPCFEAPCTFPPLTVVPTHNTAWIVKGSGFK